MYLTNALLPWQTAARIEDPVSLALRGQLSRSSEKLWDLKLQENLIIPGEIMTRLGEN